MDYVSKYVPECIKQIPVYMVRLRLLRCDKYLRYLHLIVTAGKAYGPVASPPAVAWLVLCLADRQPLHYAPPRNMAAAGVSRNTAPTAPAAPSAPAPK